MAKAMNIYMARIRTPVRMSSVQVTYYLRRITLDNGIRRNRPKHNGPRPHPGSLANIHSLSDNTGGIQLDVVA
jgi:hypothetical protein